MYDGWWEGSGRFPSRDRLGRRQEVGVVAALPPCRTLDVTCGTAADLVREPGGAGVLMDARRFAAVRRA